MSDVSHILIDRRWIRAHAPETREVRNPSTLDRLGLVPDCDAADVDAAVGAARRAQPAWWKVPGIDKAILLHALATRIRGTARALSQLMTEETGKPLIESVDCIEWVAACFDYYAEIGRQSYGNSIPRVQPDQINFTIKEPFGVESVASSGKPGWMRSGSRSTPTSTT
jgi:acyl-CoA reductase-like NAD-dependent aldehyde dehydrogenase